MGMKTYIGYYSDDDYNSGEFSNHQNAVKHFLKDVFGRTLKRVAIYNGPTIWTIKDSFSVVDEARNRLVESINPETFIKYMVNADTLTMVLKRTKDDISGTNAQALGFAIHSTPDGRITVKDDQGTVQRVFRVSLSEVEKVRHKFGADYKCENCGVELFDVDDPNGFCEV